MNALVNQVQLIGRLGADAEIKTTSQDTKVCTLRLATNERIKLRSGEWKETTQWHTCVVWGELNKVVEKYGRKGAQILVSGAIQYREYIDNQGVKRLIAEIKVNHFMALDYSSKEVDTRIEEEVDTDLPF
ncbi:single-stranded DNA-binding protein [Sphingobacterium lumbrici]|uniref:single-stranded DNA-binding protein n=1 Tax=Sphingobacterium lumbrici TaxID=2559600 RepID=UPI0011263B0F|nr:single-stranded DNA-binding protein [Sphingobacterium lumbrici]